ncbi:MAG: LEA14-like dessication related protein [Bacteroidia bacterium]
MPVIGLFDPGLTLLGIELEMLNRFRWVGFCVLVLTLPLFSGCASLVGEKDPPAISMETFRTVASESGIPRFEVTLRVANPNKSALKIAGIAYSIEILGKELIMGVTNEVPVIKPYSEEMVTLEAGLQVVGIIRLMASLGTTSKEALDYRFSAKVDFEGFVPTQRIEKTGKISLVPEPVPEQGV